MPHDTLISPVELEELDRYYRAGGLRRMASPHVHYHQAHCPHPDCNHQMEWIDFQLEMFGDPEGIYKPLVKSWWEGPGFVGRCPGCGGWVHFTSLRMQAVLEEQAGSLPRLPENWAAVAQFG